MWPDHRGSQSGAARLSFWGELTFVGWFFAVLFAPPCGAHPQQESLARYHFAIGDRSHEVSSGSVWLYSYSWYGLQSLKLADLQNGVAEISVDTEKIRRQLNPHPNTDAYVLVLQFPQNIWFRSPDISPESIWKDFRPSLDSLGQSTAQPGGDTLLILPAPAKRRITLLHEDGRPVVKTRVSVSMYLYDSNHCGSHTGLPLGNPITDGTGTVEVTAPLLPLYLDNVIYYENKGPGPAGPAYEANAGLKLGSEIALVVRKAWNFAGRMDLPEQGFDLRVVNPEGAPLPGVEIDEMDRANTCGAANGSVGQTNSAGVAHIRLVPQIVANLQLSRANQKPRPLSIAELRELFATRRLTIRW